MTNASSTVRNPDLKSEATMTRRAWVLVVLGILIPGTPQLLAGSRSFGRFAVRTTFVFWGLVALVALGYFLARPVLLTVLTNFVVLVLVQIGIVFYAALWIVLTVDTLRLVRLVRVAPRARTAVAIVAVASLVAIGGGGAYGFGLAGTTRTTVDQIFSSGPTEPPIDGRYNILLLGGDAGPDRDGLRPDSISVVSVEADSGKATMFGLPRDLADAPFVAGSPMLARYPNGYGYDDDCDVDVCQLNSIYTEVSLYHSDFYPDAAARGSQPGIEAMRDAAEGILGITIQYYVLIDMQGFSDLIDALGGVTIDSVGRFPITDTLDENGDPPPGTAWIEQGVQKMDGTTALWYARLREGTTDYDRMTRQRQVQEAILQQFDAATILTKFQDVAAAGAQVVSTDIPQSMLGYFVDLAAKTRTQTIEKIELTPPLVDPEDPDYDEIHALAAAALIIPTPEPTAAP